MNPEKAKDFVRQRSLDEVQLLDIRQPREYEREHLPGAKLIPLKQLPEEMNTLDKTKPVMFYCEPGDGCPEAAVRRACRQKDRGINRFISIISMITGVCLGRCREA